MMDDLPLDRVVTAMLRQDGEQTREGATSQVLAFLDNVDEWMQVGMNVADMFVERFDLPEEYLLDLLFS